MPITFSNKDKDLKPGSLIVCAGTITCSNVDNMGCGFNLFKKFFDQDNNKWKDTLNTILNDYHNNNMDMPCYRQITEQNGYIGAVATVPVAKTKGLIKSNLSASFKDFNKQYKNAVQASIQDSIKLKRPLFIQPLGIGVYGWTPKVAAKIFFEAISEEQSEEIDITITLYDQNPHSNDQLFKNELSSLLVQENDNNKEVKDSDSKQKSELSSSVNTQKKITKPAILDDQLKSKYNINMQILGGVIAAIGIASVAIAFVALHAATFGLAGLIVAGFGAAAILGGVGLFAIDTYKESNSSAFNNISKK